MRPKPRRPHSNSRPTSRGNNAGRSHPPKSVVLPPEFEQVFDVLDEAYGDPRRAEIPLDAELWVSAFLGALKVRDDVEVEIEVDLGR